jgi:SAM-dependent methyltransferase
MTLDPTRRFSSRADAYERHRPSYPPDVLDLLERECGLHSGAAVADIGCGTGLLSQLFLARGCQVFGVEPNPEMRQAGRRILEAEPRFQSIEGRAEATTLAGRSVDFVTAGQAFHWFEPQAARAEFRRILKPGGWVALVWNERRNQPGFMAEYNALIARYAAERPRVNPEEIAAFFEGANWHSARFENRQQMDAEGLRGRLASSSYAPQPGTAEFDVLAVQLDKLFDRYSEDGLVTIVYDTDVYYGSWNSRP